MGYVTAAMLILAAAGTAVTVIGQQQQAKAQSAMSNYNARLREQEAADAQRDARIRANQQREANRRFLATVRSRGGASGVLQDTGSPLEVLADNAQQLEMGALETERTGNIQAGQLRTQAVFDRMQGKSIRRGANYASAGAILGGASQMAGAYAGAGSGGASRAAASGKTVNYGYQTGYVA